jgi:cell wall-associated NlpC family hydrolase
MSVFLYSPGIKVYISTQDNGIIDLSEDLVSGTLVRRSSGVSTFSFMLQNVRRKYDGIFAPNDRIIVMMKRLSWMRVLTGYINRVPLVTAWPQTVNITASCSLKRLQYWFWDPGLASTQTLVANAMTAAQQSDDGGVANAVLTILNNVVGWPPEKVHIAGIPQEWFKFAYKIAKNVEAEAAEADQLAQQFYAILGAGGSVGGVLRGGAVASGALKPGTYGGYQLDATQCGYAVTIYNTGVHLSAQPRDLAVGIMTAMTESGLRNIGFGTSDSLGLFQQRPSQGWGTAAQIMNPVYAATKFFKALLAIGNRDSLSLPMEAQTVQHSAFADGSNYAVYEKLGIQVVAALSGGQGQSLANDPSFSNNVATGKAGKALGSALLQTALTLVQDHPHIPYQLGGDSPPNSAVPTQLDCSSFVQWVYFHTLGNLGGCPRTSQDQSAWCQARGRIVSAAEGLNIRGALMYHGQPGQADHTEISLGDGHHTVGAHFTGTYCGVVSGGTGYWTCAGLAPALDYSADSGTTTASGVASGVQLSQSSQQPWYDPNNPFDKLFGNSPWVPEYNVDTALSEALTGPRALLNDQPMLPYIRNLIGSTCRAFSSAPNGDFISWFPDYYGLWGTAAIMRIEPIELQDFTVYWDDTYLVTHQYTVAPPSQNALALNTGTVENSGPLLAVTTTGIATIDVPAIMSALFGLEPTKAQAQKFISYIYQRFGARPDFSQMPGVVGPSGEFFSALYLFMQSWAYQYDADVPLTFMPELWPGMIIQIPAYGFQAYVSTVTHSFQMGPGGFFSTSVNIAAPARLPGNDGDSSGNLIGLPLAGGLTEEDGQPEHPLSRADHAAGHRAGPDL